MSNVSSPEKNGSVPSSSVVQLTVLRKSGSHPIHREAHHGTHHEHHAHHDHHPHLKHQGVAEANDHSHSYSITIPAAPLTFVFARQRFWAGVRFLSAAVLAWGIGIFLFTQISSTPALKIQVGMVAGICCVLGLALLPLAARDLFGRLRIDSQGIRMTPGFLGFNIPWSELTEWDVNGVTFQFKSVKRKHAFTTDFETLSGQERLELQSMLQGCVPDKEGRLLRKQNA